MIISENFYTHILCLIINPSLLSSLTLSYHPSSLPCAFPSRICLLSGPLLQASIFQIKEKKWYLSFCVWIILLNMLSSIHFSANKPTLLFIMAKYYSIARVWHILLCTPLLILWLSCCEQCSNKQGHIVISSVYFLSGLHLAVMLDTQ